MSKLAQRSTYTNSHRIMVSLTGNIGCIEICDNGIYPDGDSRNDRQNLGFNTMMIPLMTRDDLKELKLMIKEVLKNSK